MRKCAADVVRIHIHIQTHTHTHSYCYCRFIKQVQVMSDQGAAIHFFGRHLYSKSGAYNTCSSSQASRLIFRISVSFNLSHSGCFVGLHTD